LNDAYKVGYLRVIMNLMAEKKFGISQTTQETIATEE
jgi:hypothetical protein